MKKLLSALIAAFVATAALNVQAASHAGGAPMKSADKPAAAGNAAPEKKAAKKATKKKAAKKAAAKK